MPAESVPAAIKAGEDGVVSGTSEQLARLARDFRFSHHLLIRFPLGDRQDFSGNCLASDWPEALLRRYDASDAFWDCDLVAHLKQTVMPVFLRNAFTRSPAAGELPALFAAHGLSATWALSLHDQRLRHHILALSGERDAPLPEEGRQLLYRAHQIVDGCGRHEERDEKPLERLSGREIECLRWSAAGKSSEEMAIILDISAHTVATYLKSAMRKLDAVNRMQAVARACRYRLL